MIFGPDFPVLGQALQAFVGHVFKYETDAGPDPPVLGLVFHDFRRSAMKHETQNTIGHDVTFLARLPNK